MQTTTISQCTKIYQFRSFEKWPKHLPAIAWESHLLCGFDRQENETVVHLGSNEGTFIQVFQSIYKELCFAEFAELSLVLGDDVTEFARAYHFSWNHNQQQLIQNFLKLSESFQNWCLEKKVAANELAILNSFKNLDSLKRVCEFIVSHSAGKQIGIQILEMAGELILMEKDIQDILNSTSAEIFLAEVKKRRFPQSTALDQTQEQWLKSLGWPSTSQTKWIRRGDKSGVELKLFFSTPLELQKNIVQLQRIGEKWTTQSNLPS